MSASVSARRPWLALLAGPLAWAIDELAAIAIAYDHCAAGMHVAGWRAIMSAIGIAALAIAAWSMASSWRLIAGEPLDTGLGEVTSDRVRFTARFALVIGGLTFFAILLRTITLLFLGGAPC